jgi:predicted CopG family antitoxin
MSSRNVAVRKDVYDALQREKRPHESFTQLFLRLLNQRGPLDELRGVWPKAATSSETHAWAQMRAVRGVGRRGR